MRYRTATWVSGGFMLGLLGLNAGEPPMKVTATEIERTRIYHSPQTPGYTCWVGAWVQPDGALRVALHQATGPFQGRPGGRKDVMAALGWPPPGMPAYDMTGTIQEVITLESRDAGKTWAPFATEPFHTPMNGVYSGHAALADGTVLRTGWGLYLPFYDVPQTGYVQRSVDGGRTWGAPLVLMDPARAITLPKRTRVLRDGRVLVAGGYIPLTPAVPDFRTGLKHIQAALWLSSDGGLTWGEPLVLLTKEGSVELTEESDVAELPDGRLLAITRTNVPDRWQTLLRPAGPGYGVEALGKAPFPHSGMPEMLAAREGVTLHLATSGISWTADAGKTWTDLGLGTSYYPSAVQLPDGRIFVAAHLGSDDPYDGRHDQSIEGLSFRLKVE